jgi:hypothetical protein
MLSGFVSNVRNAKVKFLLVYALILFVSFVDANPIEKNKAQKGNISAGATPHFPLPETYFPNQETADAYSEVQSSDRKETEDYFESQGFSEKGLPDESDILPSVSSLHGKSKNMALESLESDHIPQNPLAKNKNYKVEDVSHKPRNILQND